MRSVVLAAMLAMTPAMAAAGEQLFGKGDVVFRKEVSEALPNAFGGKSLFRKRQIGFVEVRYLGFSDGVAHFGRRNVRYMTNETSMNSTPLIIGRGRDQYGNERAPLVLPHGVGAEASVRPLTADEIAVDVDIAADPVLIVEGKALRVVEAAQNHVTIDVPGKGR